MQKYAICARIYARYMHCELQKYAMFICKNMQKYAIYMQYICKYIDSICNNVIF